MDVGEEDFRSAVFLHAYPDCVWKAHLESESHVLHIKRKRRVFQFAQIEVVDLEVEIVRVLVEILGSRVDLLNLMVGTVLYFELYLDDLGLRIEGNLIGPVLKVVSNGVDGIVILEFQDDCIKDSSLLQRKSEVEGL